MHKRFLLCLFIILGIMACGGAFWGSLKLAEAQSSDAVTKREAELQAELDDVLKQIADQQVVLQGEQAKGASIQRDINILDSQIKSAQLKIRAHQIAIEGLGKDINVKTATISDIAGRIDKNKESLAQLIRKTDMVDAVSMPEIVLGESTLSNFFIELDEYDSIKESMKTSFADLRQNKSSAETEKASLDKKRLQEIDAKYSVEAEQAKIKQAESDKQKLLALSKSAQSSYQSVLNQKQQQAAQIRSALFALRDTSSIPFGDALKYATAASAKTGVRPAFVLAILTQESNLGKNTGSCYLKDVTTGAGVGANTGTSIASVMSPTRDVPVFLNLMQGLGRDPFSTRVSCPQSIGWGGAMGPAQFIPSTWQLMASSIGALVGKATPDPWNPQDAFMASSLYLSNLGASAGTPSAERDAACRYYSGRACAAGPGSSYGDSVMAKATVIQTTMIDPLQGL